MYWNFLNRISLLFVLLGNWVVSSAAQEEYTENLDVLIIGNSYSRDAFSYTPMIIENLCPYVKMNMQILYIGGVALDTHWKRIKEEIDFTLDSYTSDEGRWHSISQIDAGSVFSSWKWDCIILQEGGMAARSYNRTYEDIKPIIDLIKTYQSNASFAFMINPTHPVGSEKLGEYTSDEEFSIITSVSHQLLQKGIIDYLIPCGTAIQNARNTYLDNYGDYGHLSYEGKHLQEGIPCWIEAYTAARVLMTRFGLEERKNSDNLRITQEWVKEKNIPGRHGKVIEGRASDYRLAEICALKAIDSPYTTKHTTVSEIFPEIFKPSHFNLEAHRGFSDGYPENTILAFEQAGYINEYDAIETDVRQTSDGVLVCMHDETIDRTTNGSGKIDSLTYLQIQQYVIDGGIGWNKSYIDQLKIPVFSDYIEICKRFNKIPYVELSSLSNEGVMAVVSMLHEYGYKDGSYVLTSFSLKSLKFASTICDTPLEFMKGDIPENSIASYSKIRNIVLRPSAKNVTRDFVEECEKNGLISECYGIGVRNDSQLEMFKSFGVYGGTCNSYKFNNKASVEGEAFEDKDNNMVFDFWGYRKETLTRGINILKFENRTIKVLK